MKEKVLQAMRDAGKPISAGDVTKHWVPTAKKLTRLLPN